MPLVRISPFPFHFQGIHIPSRNLWISLWLPKSLLLNVMVCIQLVKDRPPSMLTIPFVAWVRTQFIFLSAMTCEGFIEVKCTVQLTVTSWLVQGQEDIKEEVKVWWNFIYSIGIRVTEKKAEMFLPATTLRLHYISFNYCEVGVHSVLCLKRS